MNDKCVLNMSKEDFAILVQKRFNMSYSQEEYNDLTLDDKKDFIENIIDRIKFQQDINLVIGEVDNFCDKYVTVHGYKRRLLNLEE